MFDDIFRLFLLLPEPLQALFSPTPLRRRGINGKGLPRSPKRYSPLPFKTAYRYHLSQQLQAQLSVSKRHPIPIRSVSKRHTLYPAFLHHTPALYLYLFTGAFDA